MTKPWPTSTVGEQFEVKLGKMLDAARNSGSPKPYLGNRAVQWGHIDLTAVGVVPLTDSDLRRYRLRTGDLLVCEGGEIGRAAIWRNQLPECYYQKALHRLRPTAGYDVRLMQAFLQYWSLAGKLSDYVTQTSIAHLPRERFLHVPLPQPSPPEQRRIGDALEDMDDLIAVLEKSSAKKRATRRGVVQQLLSGKTRLPGNGGTWTSTQLESLLAFKNGLNKGREYFGAGTPIINFMDVMRGPLITADVVAGRVTLTRDEVRRFSARCGDVIFTRTSETVDEVGTAAALVDDIPNAVFSGFTLRGRPKTVEVDSRFLAHLFQLDAVRRQVTLAATYTTRALTNGQSLGRVIVELPGAAEQRAIVKVITDIDCEIASFQRRIDKARAIKEGMMQELLTGRTRLPIAKTAV